MTTHFITVLNGVITGRHCGDVKADFSKTTYHGHNRIVIPENAQTRNNDKITFYNKNWVRKSDIQLIDEGFMPVPYGYIREGDNLRLATDIERIIVGIDELQPGFKIENNEIIPMTQVERILAGIDKVQPGYKIEGNELIEMTEIEQLEAGQISQTEYDNKITAENQNELNRRLAELQTPEALAMAEIDEKYAAERKSKLIALLAVKQMADWPLIVKWP